MTPVELAAALKQKAHQIGFTLVGITSSDAPMHFDVYRHWVQQGRHADMAYLETSQALERRADPRLILQECRSILVLGIPYTNPQAAEPVNEPGERGRVAAYAWGDDYHLVLPERLETLVHFLEALAGHSIPNRWYTDTGPILERELAQRAGLGWIGKNTCLINPQAGSYFLLAEILLGIELPADEPFSTDQCGSCTRCIDACPTDCILPDRTINAQRCISYLTIENKAFIPADLRPLMGEWVFGCDICQMACPWNTRFAHQQGDPAFLPKSDVPYPLLANELGLTPHSFNQKFKTSPIKRAKRRGYLRNVAIASANIKAENTLKALENAEANNESLVSEHARWAIEQIKKGKN